MTGTNGTNGRRPRKGVITKADMGRYLELIASGMQSPEAARALDPEGDRGLTGRKFRALRRREAAFDDAYQAALADQRPAIVERLRDRLLTMALDPENKNPRVVHNALVLWDVAYREAHKQRVEMTGADGGPVEVANVEGAAESLREKLATVVSLDQARQAAARARSASTG